MIFTQPILSHTLTQREWVWNSINKRLGSIIWLDLLLLSQILNYLKIIQHGQNGFRCEKGIFWIIWVDSFEMKSLHVNFIKRLPLLHQPVALFWHSFVKTARLSATPEWFAGNWPCLTAVMRSLSVHLTSWCWRVRRAELMADWRCWSSAATRC